MTKQYLLIIVLNDSQRFKKVKKKLFELGQNRFTVIDSYGTLDILEGLEFSNMMSESLSGQSGKKYNKTLMLVIEDEDTVNYVMDEIEAVQSYEVKNPGKGIMFTIPIYQSLGVRFGE